MEGYLNGLCIPFIKCLMTNVSNVTNKYYNVSKILLQHCLPIITVTRVRDHIEHVLGCLPNENITFMSKIVT